jgi:LacI family repressor for deo operon, udp, cdd, tsx, nupC, and nupG
MTISMKDIARVAGVSLSTVSRALADSPRVKLETRLHLQRLAKEMGYEPSAIARGLATKRTHSLGVVVMDITDAFVAELVRALDRAALDRGYSLILSHCGADPEREMAAIKLLRQKRVDAIIVADPRVAESYLPSLQESGVPVILVNRRSYRYAVSTDNVSAARQAMEHLLRLEHRRIAYIGDVRNPEEDRERRAGYEQALTARGIPVEPALGVEGNGQPEGGRQAMMQLLSLPDPPSAIFCFNDLTAIGAMQAAQANSFHVPQDLSLIGFDDIHLASYLSPPLTTVGQPKERIAGLAVETALSLAEGKEPPTDRLLPGTLVIRGSTAPPRRGT